MTSHLWWYVARASGIVSWVLLSASVLWGLFVSTRLLGSRPKPAWLLDLHRFLAGLSVTFVVVHLVGLVGDSYVHFGITELFVPFASSWRPGPVAWGIAGLYLILAVQITSLFMRKLPRKLWLWIHRSSVLLFGVATVHGLTSGTDVQTVAARVVAIVTAGLVLFLWMIRRLSPRKAARAAARAAHQRAAPASAAASVTPARASDLSSVAPEGAGR